MLPRMGITAMLLVLIALAAPARAQPATPDAPDDDDDARQTAPPRDPGTSAVGNTGYIGSSEQTLEVDRCRTQRTGDDVRRTRASEHYKRGNVLYEQGDYEGAIAEFVAAYCHAPNYIMHKNIAQSYERLIEYERAVAYLERYILESPEDAVAERERVSFRVEVLRNLPARVKVATVPPEATVTISGDQGVVARGRANADEPMRVRRGAYVMRVEAAGYEPVTQEIDAEIGQPYSFYFRLDPKQATLRVTTVPANARLIVNNELVGVGRYFQDVPIGSYEISAEASDFVTAQRAVELTPGEVANLTIELEPEPDSGRSQLLWFSGFTAPIWGATAFGGTLDDSSAGGLGFLGGLALGLGARLIVPEDISVGTSSYIIGAAAIGTMEGLTLGLTLLCRTSMEDGLAIETCNERAITGAAVGGTALGVGAALATASRLDLDAGDAALLNSGALWGSVAAFITWLSFDSDERLDGPLLFGGLNLGLAAGVGLASRYDVSRKHVALIDLSGIAGIVVGLAGAGVIDEEAVAEQRANFALGGLAVGLIAGTYLTRDMDAPAMPASIAPQITSIRDASGQQATALGIGGQF